MAQQPDTPATGSAPAPALGPTPVHAHAHAHAPAAATASGPVLVMPLPALAHFQRLMQAEGWAVDLQRMCVDDSYALQRLAAGHCSSDAQLRQAAVGLFAAYQRNAAPPALH